MPRAGLTPAAVVEAGAALADEVGFTDLTMGLVAERLGVRTPSLYKHVDSLDALRRGVAVQAKRELTHAVARAAVGRFGPDAVRAFADAYRRWALDHPGRYAATVRAPAAAAADDEEDRRVSNEAVQVLYDVLAGFKLRDAQIVDAARSLRAAIHGFAALEAADGFGLHRDVTRSYHFLIDSLIAGLQADQHDHPTSPEDDQDEQNPSHRYHETGTTTAP
ncbi:TetR/AcrR family transcriptional regulator [Streptomyces sp. NPDC058961]|uniref:TetR/AcrR family transcriptional regulator n=1 Tax=Streptomyces TaxID=1883 RepID=UPI000C272CD1|nr:TetR/AcrR family transcriptional regulator [Streptomyces sp. CB01201]PJM98938.1 TetR family transcriptional regulator [Streptomyces sp. CB01201]